MDKYVLKKKETISNLIKKTEQIPKEDSISNFLNCQLDNLKNEYSKEMDSHERWFAILAAKLYLDAGFKPLNTEEKAGWEILKRLTNHSKLINFAEATDDEMYDKRNIEIEKQLNEIYGIDNYNYAVWYKNGLHNVYVYCHGKSYEYEYYEENDKIKLEEVISKTS